MKVAIVGAGFCGLAVAWHFMNFQSSISNLKVQLFDYKKIGQGTSGIAAGLLHPFAGAHAKLNSRGIEGFKATEQLLEIASSALGYSVVAEKKGILRSALNEMQQVDFQLCAKKYPHQTEWLDQQACQLKAPGSIQAPGLWIKEGLTVYSSLYLQGLWQACMNQGATFYQQYIQSLEELQDFEVVIFTTGAESSASFYPSSVALKSVKGQVLELAWPPEYEPLNCAINSQVYLLMTSSKKSCLVGATYEKIFSNALPDLKIAQEELLPKAYLLFPALEKMPLLNCYAGLRGVTPQHMPIFKQLSSNHWTLTGMGSKGLLYHALFAKELVTKIYENISLHNGITMKIL